MSDAVGYLPRERCCR